MSAPVDLERQQLPIRSPAFMSWQIPTPFQTTREPYSCLWTTTTRIVPILILLLFFIAGTVVMVFTFADDRALPVKFTIGVGATFAILISAWAVGQFALCVRDKRHVDRSVSSRSGSQRNGGHLGTIFGCCADSSSRSSPRDVVQSEPIGNALGIQSTTGNTTSASPSDGARREGIIDIPGQQDNTATQQDRHLQQKDGLRQAARQEQQIHQGEPELPRQGPTGRRERLAALDKRPDSLIINHPSPMRTRTSSNSEVLQGDDSRGRSGHDHLESARNHENQKPEVEGPSQSKIAEIGSSYSRVNKNAIPEQEHDDTEVPPIPSRNETRPGFRQIDRRALSRLPQVRNTQAAEEHPLSK